MPHGCWQMRVVIPSSCLASLELRPVGENNKVFGSPQSFVAGSPKNGVQFMVKDSRKYAATAGWGFAQFNDARNLGDVERPVWGGLNPSIGSGNKVRFILPIRWIYGGRDGSRTAGHLDMRRATGVPELCEDPAALGMHSLYDPAPSFDLLIGVKTRRSKPSPTS
jgi:hypothetical protein